MYASHVQRTPALAFVLVLIATFACRPQAASVEPSGPEPLAETPPPRDRPGPVEFCGQVFQPDEIVVECHDPSVKSVEPLVALPALQAIDLEGASVRDVAVLQTLGELEDLYLARTPIESLASVAKLQLEMLDIGETAIEDLSPLASSKTLRDLRFTDTLVSDLSPLAGIETLEEIDALGSKVDDLSALASLPALRELRVSDCPVNSLEPLRELRSLERLDISGTHVSSLEPLYALPELQYLNADHAAATLREVDAFREAQPAVEVHAVYNAE